MIKLTWHDDIFSNEKVTYPSEDSAEPFRHDLPAGAAELDVSEGGVTMELTYVCPCGCGRVRFLPAKTGQKEPRWWLWDGNAEAPTISPSIQIVGNCGWHGHLVNGEWIPC